MEIKNISLYKCLTKYAQHIKHKTIQTLGWKVKVKYQP